MTTHTASPRSFGTHPVRPRGWPPESFAKMAAACRAAPTPVIAPPLQAPPPPGQAERVELLHSVRAPEGVIRVSVVHGHGGQEQTLHACLELEGGGRKMRITLGSSALKLLQLAIRKAYWALGAHDREAEARRLSEAATINPGPALDGGGGKEV